MEFFVPLEILNIYLGEFNHFQDKRKNLITAEFILNQVVAGRTKLGLYEKSLNESLDYKIEVKH